MPGKATQTAKTKLAVTSASATLYPRADCRGCKWRMPLAATVAACKAHVAETGHTVVRVRETIDQYGPVH
jgi:hypothetical protein